MPDFQVTLVQRRPITYISWWVASLYTLLHVVKQKLNEKETKTKK